MKILCQICGKSFANKNSLRTHRHNYHNQIDVKGSRHHPYDDRMKMLINDDSDTLFERFRADKYKKTTKKLDMKLDHLAKRVKIMEERFATLVPKLQSGKSVQTATKSVVETHSDILKESDTKSSTTKDEKEEDSNVGSQSIQCDKLNDKKSV